jgi:ADP-ribose pyrophosphatase YjhB (NUDIX family)
VVHWKKVKLWEGVKREVHEETGLDVEVEQLAGIYYTPRQNQIAFSYFCSIIGGKLMVNEESDAFKYFALVEIPENFPPRPQTVLLTSTPSLLRSSTICLNDVT